MSLYFTQDNDDELKKYYKFTLESQSAEENNTYLRVLRRQIIRIKYPRKV